MLFILGQIHISIKKTFKLSSQLIKVMKRLGPQYFNEILNHLYLAKIITTMAKSVKNSPVTQNDLYEVVGYVCEFRRKSRENVNRTMKKEAEKVMRSLTLCLLKPQLVANPWATKNVNKIIRQQGFRIEQSVTTRLNLERAERLYRSHCDKFFYGRLLASISSGPLIAYILSRENAIKRWRDIMGPTKVCKTVFSNPYSIRGRFGLTDTRNATHGSDSPESVIDEIAIFFPKFSVEDWYIKQNSYNIKTKPTLVNEKS